MIDLIKGPLGPFIYKDTMNVTLMTDASICGDTGAAGYGYWVVSKRGGVPGQGKLKGRIKDSLEGEMKAVVNSLAAAVKTHVIEDGDTILIQLDNQGVIGCIEGKCRIRKDMHPMLKELKCIAIKHNLTIECRHVKGHTNRKDNRYISNKMCDLRAKEEMRKARQLLEQK